MLEKKRLVPVRVERQVRRAGSCKSEWKGGLVVREKIKGETREERQAETGLPEGEFLPLPPRALERVFVLL